MAATTTITGIAGVSIAGTCTGPTTGTTVLAADVNGALQSCCNDLATIKSGVWATSATVSCTGGWTFTNAVACSGITKLGGRAVLRPVRVSVPDNAASKTLAALAGGGVDYVGKAFQLAGPAAGPRVRVISTLGLSEGELIDVYCGAAAASLITGPIYTFERDDATVIAQMIVTAIGSNALTLYAQFEMVGGVIRLGASSGAWYDGTAQVGVVAGAGA